MCGGTAEAEGINASSDGLNDIFIFVFFLKKQQLFYSVFKHVDIYTNTRHTHKYKANIYRPYNGVKEEKEEEKTTATTTAITTTFIGQ